MFRTIPLEVVTTVITGTATESTVGFDASNVRIPPVVAELDAAESAVFTAVVDVAVPSAAASAAATWVVATDVITIAAHGFYTGLKGQVTSDGTKPTGISLLTDYFIRRLSSSTFSLYDTYAHAINLGSTTGLVDITNVGTGNHTFTPVAIAGCAINLQGYDGVQWVDVPYSSRTVTVDTTLIWQEFDLPYPKYRLKTTITAGLITVIGTVQAKIQ